MSFVTKKPDPRPRNYRIALPKGYYLSVCTNDDESTVLYAHIVNVNGKLDRVGYFGPITNKSWKYQPGPANMDDTSDALLVVPDATKSLLQILGDGYSVQISDYFP